MMAFQPHPGMQHPGMPHGQPMGPGGQLHHPGQVMGQQMVHQQGPGGPMVSQGGPMMAGMQHGMGMPGAHTNMHLMQQHQQAQQQQANMQQHMNAQQMAVRQNMARQQQMMQAQQAQAQQLQHQQAQQAQHQGHPQHPQQGGMPMGFQGHPGGLTPQQIHHIQQQQQQQQAARGMMAGLPGQPMQQLTPEQIAGMQMQQQRFLQQQQHAAAQAQAHAQQQQQHHQQNMAVTQAQQHAQQAHMAQAQAMQHANSQSSNHNTPQPMMGQPPAGPMRPNTAMSAPRDAQSSPAPPPKPQQAPNQTPTSVPPPNVSAAQMQQPQQSPAPGPGMQGVKPGQGPPAQMGMQQPQMAQQQAVQMQQQNAQQQQQLQLQRQAGQQAPNAAVPMTAQMQQSMMLAMQRRHDLASRTLLRLFRFADALGRSGWAEQDSNELEHWQNLVSENFTESGKLSFVLHDMVTNGTEVHKPKQYDVFNSIMPQFFWAQFQNTVEQIQLVLEGTRESFLDNTTVLVTADRARMIYWYRGEGQVVMTGSLQALFIQEKDRDPKMESLTFDVRHHEHFLPRSRVLELCEAALALGSTKSPKLAKNAGGKKGQGKQAQAQASSPKLIPESPAGELGFSEATQLWLEMCETFGVMVDLMACSKENPNLSLTNSMQAYIASSQRQIQQMDAARNNPQLMQQLQQQGMNGMANRQVSGQQMGVSPAMQSGFISNGSPHLSAGPISMQSPALTNMAPPMAAQRSQQGNTGAGASAGTSPNMSTKRRRSTQVNSVKNEEDGLMINGTAKKVKPSPSMANAKRGKQG